jgi:hypothetical protein
LFVVDLIRFLRQNVKKNKRKKKPQNGAQIKRAETNTRDAKINSPAKEPSLPIVVRCCSLLLLLLF